MRTQCLTTLFRYACASMKTSPPRYVMPHPSITYFATRSCWTYRRPLPVSLYQGFPTFDRAVDTFFSELEAQKTQQRAMQQERAALKKLEKARSTHQQRVEVGIARDHMQRSSSRSTPYLLLFAAPTFNRRTSNPRSTTSDGRR